jgi:hypothetical protein
MDIFKDAADDLIREQLQEKESEMKEANVWKAETADTKPTNFVKMPDVGWKVLPTGNLPSKGLFYPAGFEIEIKPATAKEIRHFSSVDDNDPIDLYDKLNFIIKNGTRVKIQGRPASYKDLLDVDRFSVVYAIRQLTFKESPNLSSEMTCHECGTVNVVNITNDNFLNFELDERIMKYYDSAEQVFNFKMSDDFEFKLYMPNIGLSEFVSNYVQTNARKGNFIDKDFINMSTFICPSYKKLNNALFKKISMDTLNWTAEQIRVVVGVIDIIRESMDANVTFVCKSCEEENKQAFTFRSSAKELFLITRDDIFSKLS